MADLILFNKPFQVLCQFTDDREGEPRSTLADYIRTPDVYPAGRLDYDSEGLLLLTGNGMLQHRIASPERKMPKTYWVQVEGDIDDDAIKTLCDGVLIRDGMTRPATVRRIPEPADLWPRTPPVRHREAIPTSWLEITLTEGRNRQVRRMTAAVGYPTLRLIRYRIGDWTLAGLHPGDHRTETIHLPRAETPKRRGPPTRRPRRK